MVIGVAVGLAGERWRGVVCEGMMCLSGAVVWYRLGEESRKM